jgi:DNA-directed RNA polymerase subunit RPC12/RpoP
MCLQAAISWTILRLAENFTPPRSANRFYGDEYIKMKAGEITQCPHCGQSTVLKEKVLVDGWTKTGQVLACAICGNKIADIPAAPTVKAEKDNALSGLAALLQTESESKPEIKINADEKLFCRDCEHFIAHPFLSRCTLHNKEVNPMDDCPDFKPKPEEV